jgi:hypothetical protein
MKTFVPATFFPHLATMPAPADVPARIAWLTKETRVLASGTGPNALIAFRLAAIARRELARLEGSTR